MAQEESDGPRMSPVFGLGLLGLPLLCSMSLLPLLHWQRAMLRGYQKAVEEWGKSSEAESRSLALLLLETYLEYTTSSQELRQRLAAGHSALLRDSLEFLEGVRRRSEGKN